MRDEPNNGCVGDWFVIVVKQCEVLEWPFLYQRRIIRLYELGQVFLVRLIMRLSIKTGTRQTMRQDELFAYVGHMTHKQQTIMRPLYKQGQCFLLQSWLVCR